MRERTSNFKIKKKTTKIGKIDEFKIFKAKNHLKLHYCLRQLLIKISIFLWKF